MITVRGAAVAGALALLLAAGAAHAADPARGAATGLPIDPDLAGCWLRPPSGDVPGEAVCYRDSGEFLRLTRREPRQDGIWVTWTRGKLRWLRRCSRDGGGPVGPGDCDTFGRYMVDEDELIEEEVCPRAWVGLLTREPDFDSLRRSCEVVATRLGPFPGEATLQQAFAEMLEGVAVTEPEASTLLPRATSGGEGSLQGTWVGAVGTGPGRITLTFYAREDGSFEYVLEAAGQSDSAGGTWARDDGSLVLTHEDGEVETIPFRLEGEALFWTDEAIGELRLKRSS